MMKKILRVVRLSAGFGGIWVADGGHFGRLRGHFASPADFRHAVAPWMCRSCTISCVAALGRRTGEITHLNCRMTARQPRYH